MLLVELVGSDSARVAAMALAGAELGGCVVVTVRELLSPQSHQDRVVSAPALTQHQLCQMT